MDQDKDREAFEKAVITEGLPVNLSKVGPASRHAGEYADIIVQTCWQVWQLAKDYYTNQRMNIKHNDDGTYEVSITVTPAQTGRTPLEAFGKLYENSFEARMYIARHPESFNTIQQEYGTKTDEELVRLFKRMMGY